MLPETANAKMNPGYTGASLHERAVVQNVPQKFCSPCHTSCLRCRGPSEHECTECSAESVYREVSPNETYCDTNEHDVGSPKVVKLFQNNQHSNETAQNFSHKSIPRLIYDHISIYMIVIYGISVTMILFTIYIITRTFFTNPTTNGNDKKNYAYNRIAYDGNNDQIVMEQEMIINTSDSSEETEPIK